MFQFILFQGWIECVGCADRSAYDLTQHTKATGVRLSAEKTLNETKVVDVVEVVPNKATLGKSFKKDAKIIADSLTNLEKDEIANLEKELETKGCVFFI